MKLLFLGLLIFSQVIHAQTITQTVRGKVTDTDTKSGLPGANVILLNSTPLNGTTTDVDGNFILENVPVGRQSLQVSFMGFKSEIVPEILVSSGKQTVLNIELEEEILQAKEVEIKATVNKNEPINAMAMVSARSFSIDESRRYAGPVISLFPVLALLPLNVDQFWLYRFVTIHTKINRGMILYSIFIIFGQPQLHAHPRP